MTRAGQTVGGRSQGTMMENRSAVGAPGDREGAFVQHAGSHRVAAPPDAAAPRRVRGVRGLAVAAVVLLFGALSWATTPGTITNYAGDGVSDYFGDDGPAILARINDPDGIAVDAAGNLFIADQANFRVRRVDAATREITTVAGNGTWTYFNYGASSGDGGPATSAGLSRLKNVAVDAAGNLYICDTDNHRVRKVDVATLEIAPFAGDGDGGRFLYGDGGPATSASVDPAGIAFDGSGNVYIADGGHHAIRMVAPDGIITTVAGIGGPDGRGFGGDGGPATSAKLNGPNDVACDGAGNLYIADSGNARIRRVDAQTREITTVAGTGGYFASGDGGPATSAGLNVNRLALDARGNIYFTDTGNYRVRKVDTDGNISTIGGNGGTGGSTGDDGPATSAQIYSPNGIAVDRSGNVYVSSANGGYGVGSSRVRRIEQIASAGNTPPVAEAGPDQTVEATSATATNVTLDGSGSSDPDDDALTYAWTWAGGTASGANPTIALPYGDTTITLTVDDGKGDTSTDTVVIHVTDDQDPVVSIDPVPAVVGADRNPLAIVGRVDDVTATSVVLTPGAFSTSFLPGGGIVARDVPLAEGDNEIVLSATDEAGRTGSAIVHVTLDTTPPVITVPADITVEATGPSGATVDFISSSTDTVDGSIAPSCSPASGSTFALGTTTVICSATDARGNPGTASFTVTVEDRTPPVVTVPADMTVEATGPSGAVVDFSSSATDTVDGSIAPSCSPASGSTLALGTTTVTCTATDAAGNPGIASFTVTVDDNTPPTVVVPADMTVEATGPSGATVEFSSSATDTVDGSIAPSCSPASGSTFALGTTTVTCSATDAHGNPGSATFTVTVVDRTPPTLSGVPASMTVEATNAKGATVVFAAPTAMDLVDGPVKKVSCTPPSGTTFPLGDTKVTCTATDAAGNPESASFFVTVLDRTPPALSGVPANMTVEATSEAGAAVAFAEPTAMDLVDGPVSVLCTPPSGTTFPLGDTRVDCTAMDAAGNPATGGFRVRVRDTAPPTLTLPEDISAVTSGSHAGVSMPVSATDLVDTFSTITLSSSPSGIPFRLFFVEAERTPEGWRVTATAGAAFPVGTTTVTCTATDDAGNTSMGTVQVTVRTLGQATADLAEQVEAAGLPSGVESPLTSLLDAANFFFAQPAILHVIGLRTAGVNQLRAFQRKVQSSSPPIDEATAQAWIAAAQRIIDAAGG